MSGLFTRYALGKELDDFMAGTFAGNSGVRLFTNNYTPDDTSSVGDFTEPTFGGYAPQAPTFSSPAIWDGVDSEYVVSGFVSFTPTSLAGSLTMYGYFILDATGVLVAERFASPVTLVSIGVPFLVQITLKNKNA